MNFCFIFGIQKRSGTNYLWRLLRSHPHCVGPGAMSEDYLLYHSDLLRDYSEALYRRWSNWNIRRFAGGQELLPMHLGEALCRFLAHQLPPQARSEDAIVPTLVTKTPTVKHLASFLTFFPKAKAVVVVRDGRDLVESGVRSFNWLYEDAMRRWAHSARTITAVLSREDAAGRILTVRYEDLCKNQEGQIKRVLEFLNLETSLFDFAAASDADVVGSSETRREGDTVHWKPQQKTAGFKPTQRSSGWSAFRNSRFNWIAGDASLQLGYALRNDDRTRVGNRIFNRVLDAAWAPALLGLKAIRDLRGSGPD